jgi:ABC-2 type transport system ATP-binding protein
MSGEQPVVEISHLTKKYGEFTALDDLTLTVEKGQILGFVGPNGAGKTTTIKILVGLARPTSGSARIAGVDCSRDARKIKRLVGYMPDGFGSYDNMRVREYLDFFGAAFGLYGRQRQARIDEVLQTTRAAYMQDRFVESLSHGMQQRLGIARTLLHDPEVLILDEPANGLDPQARIEMRDLILHLAERGKTLIVTSHILPELSRICNRVAIITQGKLRAVGSLEQILQQVNQRRRFEVQLRPGDDPLPAENALRARLGTEASSLHSSATESIVRFESALPDTAISDLLTSLVQAQVRVTQFRELQADLEDAFLSVTQREANSTSTLATAST